MLYDMVKVLIKITEDFGGKHAVMDTINQMNIKKTSRPSHLNTMSPGHLFRKPGLNITKHKKIMASHGVPTK